MKIRVTLKDPDALQDAINEAVDEEIKKLDDILREDSEDISEVFEEKAKNVAREWFKYGEYLTVEIDTSAKTCTVCKV